MTSHMMLIILGGCLLGAIQLIAGVALGLWLRRTNGREAHRSRQQMLHANQIARRLQALADEMSSSVGEHRSQLDQATQLLSAEDGRGREALADLVVDVIGDVVRANQSLQSKLQTAEHRLEEQAVEIEAHISRSLTDPLTGLPNRREFNDRLEERMSSWSRRKEVFSLLMLDVDHFKKLNDEHGHLAGDQVLAMIGRLLRGAVRREDAVARYGGEEFAILLPSTSLEQAIHVAHKVRETVVATPIQHDGRQLSITVSGGLATIGGSERPESLIQRADAALYLAKAAGRNCTFVHDGVDCRSAEDFERQGPRPAGFMAELVQLINSPDAAARVNCDTSPDGDLDFGTYLPREAISTELAQTCEELRRFVEERSQRADEAATHGESHESTTSADASK
jgi:diguanylate cyclase (GGDEF)-like protein